MTEGSSDVTMDGAPLAGGGRRTYTFPISSTNNLAHRLDFQVAVSGALLTFRVTAIARHNSSETCLIMGEVIG